MPDVSALTGRVEALAAARTALTGRDAWLVGGAVRDLLRGVPVDDFDLVVTGDAKDAARELARAARAHVFPLSERFGAWRVVAGNRSWQADVTPARDGSIEADLGLRDFTLNAMASPLHGGELIDPHGGRADLESRLLRAVGPAAFTDDPLRTMRLARFACELDLGVDPGTERLAGAASRRIADVAPERSFYELARLISSPDPVRGLELMDETGLVGELLPELDALKGVEQNPYHHRDVWGHTLEVLTRLLEIEADPGGLLGPAAEGLSAELARPLADGMTRGQALRLGALLHDAGKPATRAVSGEGRVLFWGHDAVGADMSVAFVRRFHASAALGAYLAALARHHLRLGFLVKERPLSRRQIYRYLHDCEPVELEVTVLSAADRLATRGARTRPDAIESHMDLARQLAAEALAWRAAPPAVSPLRGAELMEQLQLEPGPEVGRLLELLREAAWAGEIESPAQALELARSHLRVA